MRSNHSDDDGDLLTKGGEPTELRYCMGDCGTIETVKHPGKQRNIERKRGTYLPTKQVNREYERTTGNRNHPCRRPLSRCEMRDSHCDQSKSSNKQGGMIGGNFCVCVALTVRALCAAWCKGGVGGGDK